MTWTTDGGTIGSDGRFVAESAGAFKVRARVDSVEATAEVQVVSGTIDPPLEKGITWRGTVPPKKWMNFYTKVISRFTSAPGLRLEVSFVVPPGDWTTEAKREETKAALRELGLTDDIDQH